MTVPNSGGEKGVEAAAILRALGGNIPKRQLECCPQSRRRYVSSQKVLAGEALCELELVEEVANTLYSPGELSAETIPWLLKLWINTRILLRISKNGKIFWIKNTYWTGKCRPQKRFYDVNGIMTLPRRFANR